MLYNDTKKDEIRKERGALNSRYNIPTYTAHSTPPDLAILLFILISGKKKLRRLE
jgi:hypothetical protein